jgi:hypothetical protein
MYSATDRTMMSTNPDTGVYHMVVLSRLIPLTQVPLYVVSEAGRA